uniref:Cytochrome P450 4G189 n=1 Tax=Forficula auricularia TaxID=13068 RepID=A0A5P8N885_FORAU|nr:cytochrome P450 4G189 [Forficula auricularia]
MSFADALEMVATTPEINPEVGATETVSASSSIFWYLLVPAISLYIFYYWFSRRRLNEMASKIPGLDGFPVLGVAHRFFGKTHDEIFTELMEYIQESGDKAGKLWLGPRLHVYLLDPRDIEIILGSSVHLDKSPEYRFFEPWLGDGLLITSGNKWRRHRKIIAPTFHLNVLKSFVELFNKNTHDVIERMKKQHGKTFDAHDFMSECTVEILMETAMGVDKKGHKNGFEYAMAVMKMSNILHTRHINPFLRLNWVFNLTKTSKEQVKLLETIHGVTNKIIENKKKDFDSGQKRYITSSSTKEEDSALSANKGLKDDLDAHDDDIGQKKRLAFLDYLLESRDNGNNFTEDEIREEVNTIMFEGHDTTAAGSSFFLSVMGVHPEIQDKIYEELDAIFGDSDRDCTFQDTLEMKYLERCLLESLRMYPPVPLIAREIKKDVRLASNTNIVLPAFSTIIIGTYALHRDKDIFPNPDVFDPDNFLPEKQANRHYYSYIPFSAGPRSCVGRKFAMLKLKILLSTILRKFRIEADTEEKDFKLQADLILKRADGFPIRLVPRNRGKAIA